MSSSTSPPLKRKKKTDDVNLIESEPMDVEESFINLSIELENMEIETPKEGEDDLFSHRSKLMDEKINEKARKIDEKESLLRNKEKKADEKKKRLEDKKTENVKIIYKKRKQKQKDEKKKCLKAKKKAVSSAHGGKPKYQVLNIRDVPENCNHLVNIDDVLYVVPGDGCCGPNCGAAFLFSDEVYGPKLRRKMNIFMAKHWDRKYKYITNCSEETPFFRKMKGGKAEYTDPSELLKFLRESDEGSFMWTDCEDLSVLTDMYQFRIKVITTKGATDKNPTVNWIHPDPKL